MNRFRHTGTLALLLLLLASPTASVYGQSNADERKSEKRPVPAYANTPEDIRPYRDFHGHYKLFFADEQPFLGTGREKTPPADLKTVKIGFLGPLEGSHEAKLGRRMLQGALLALEEANASGGYNGIPFEMIVRDDVGPWGSSSNKALELNDEKVWAVLGSIDGQSTHIALRVFLKTETPFVTSGSTDPTLTETRIPWYVRVNADDRQHAYALATYVYRIKGHERVVSFRVNNRYGRVGIGEFNAAARRIGKPILFELRFGLGDKDFSSQLQKIKDSSADAVVLWTDSDEGALIVRQMREMGITLPVYGNDRLVEQEFLEVAGEAAEGLVVVYPFDPTSSNPGLKSFTEKYKERFGEDPEWIAAHAYDGMNYIIDAIRHAGLNRVLIRDWMTDQDTYEGVTGTVILDPSWNDIGPVMMAEVRDGQFHFFPSPLNPEAQRLTASE